MTLKIDPKTGEFAITGKLSPKAVLSQKGNLTVFTTGGPARSLDTWEGMPVNAQLTLFTTPTPGSKWANLPRAE